MEKQCATGRRLWTHVRHTSIVVVSLSLLAACTYESEKLDTPLDENIFRLDSVALEPELAARVPEPMKSTGTMSIGTNAVYPPAEFLDSSGTYIGYDIDLGAAIAKKLGLNVSFDNADFSNLIPALGQKYAISISSFTINAERLRNINMVSVINVGTSWAVAAGNPKKVDISQVCGLAIGVQTGTVQEDPDLVNRNAQCLREGKPPITLVTLKSQTDITTRLTNGSLDAMAADSPVVGYAIEQTAGRIEKLGATYDQEPQGIAIHKNDMPLTHLIKDALDSLRAEGTYAKIFEKWNASDGKLDTFEINPMRQS